MEYLENYDKRLLENNEKYVNDYVVFYDLSYALPFDPAGSDILLDFL